MLLQPKKPCKWCKQFPANHFAYQCKDNPKVRTYHISKQGKVAQTWWNVRRKWFADNPQEYYICYLKISDKCLGVMTPAQTTLDHVIPRSRAPHLRYEPSNLKPCCWYCNAEKGSKVL